MRRKARASADGMVGRWAVYRREKLSTYRAGLQKAEETAAAAWMYRYAFPCIIHALSMLRTGLWVGFGVVGDFNGFFVNVRVLETFKVF